jgi:hypothetical protein
MNPDTTPYQLATLAARIAPQLCADYSKQDKAATLALSLIDTAAHILNQRVAHNKKKKEAGDREEAEKAFCKLYKLTGTHIKYSRAAKVVTGHAEDRHASLAVRKFEKLMQEPDPFVLEVTAEQLNGYQTVGVPVREVISWRILAERLGLCAKKLLTWELRELPKKPRAVSENGAAGVPETAEKKVKQMPSQSNNLARKRGKRI